MWPYVVIVIAPKVNFLLCFLYVSKPVLIEALIAEFPIQAFNKGILSWLPRLDKVEPDVFFFTPEKHRLADKLRVVVSNNAFR